MDDDYSNNWHLNKSVPIATILTIILSIMSGTVWMVSVRHDIDMHWQAYNGHVQQQVRDTIKQEELDNRLLVAIEDLRKEIGFSRVEMRDLMSKERNSK